MRQHTRCRRQHSTDRFWSHRARVLSVATTRVAMRRGGGLRPYRRRTKSRRETVPRVRNRLPLGHGLVRLPLVPVTIVRLPLVAGTLGPFDVNEPRRISVTWGQPQLSGPSEPQVRTSLALEQRAVKYGHRARPKEWSCERLRSERGALSLVCNREPALPYVACYATE